MVFRFLYFVPVFLIFNLLYTFLFSVCLESYRDFKQGINKLFPIIFDTKHMNYCLKKVGYIFNLTYTRIHILKIFYVLNIISEKLNSYR